MELSPQQIVEKVQTGDLDKSTAINLLISLIDHSDDEGIRIKSVEVLKEIDVVNNKIFEVLENLLISDNNEKLRCIVATYIGESFITKAQNLINWAIQHETDYECLISIINILVKMNNFESKEILINELKLIRKTKYLDEDKHIDNKKYKRALKKLVKSKQIENLSHKDLAEIIVNYKTMSELTKKFYSVYFDLENGFVTKLDLADVEYEVRGWKSDFKNNIREISEIIGLQNLNNLTHLNISNNQLQDIKDLMGLKTITHLFIAKNQIKDLRNIEYIKGMKNLKYVDLSGNSIAQYLTPNDFPNIKVNLRRYAYF